MNKRPLLTFSLLIGLLVIGTSASLAATSADQIVANGEVRETDLNIYDDLDIEAGGVVDANVNIFGGDASIAGTIHGNLVVFGGDVELQEGAVIEGDCVVIAGELEYSGNTSSFCTTLGETFDTPVAAIADFGQFPNNSNIIVERRDGGLGSALLSSVLLSLLALGTTAVAPRHINRISDAITIKPVASGTVGFLTFIASISTIIILAVLSAVLTIVCIGLLGIPIVLALSAMVTVGLVVGWVSVGKVVGEVLRDALKLKNVSLPVTAAVGTLALSLLIGLFGLLPAVGFGASIASLIVAGIGFGAVALTRFGTRPWPLFAVDDGKEEIVIKSLPDEINLL